MAGGESLGNLYFDLGLDDKEFMSKLEAIKKGDFKIKIGIDASEINSIKSLLSAISASGTSGRGGTIVQQARATAILNESAAKVTLINTRAQAAATESYARTQLKLAAAIQASVLAQQRLNQANSANQASLASAAALAQQRLAAAIAATAAAQQRLNNVTNAGSNAASLAQQRIANAANAGANAQNRHANSASLTNRTLLSQRQLAMQLSNQFGTMFSIYAVERFVKKLAEVRGEFELQKVSLRAILQDAPAADAIFEQIKQLSVKSPFTFKGLIGYTKQLAAFSIPVNELYDTMKNLADVSAGLGVDMGRITLAFGQVRAASVLRGQELRQFTEAGIPLVEELAKKFTKLTGVVTSNGDVFEKISKRMVSFEMVKEIFDDMTSAGGKFYNMQELQAATLKGKMSNLTDSIDLALNSVGEANEGVLKGAIDLTTELIKNWESVGKAIMSLVAIYGAYKASVAVNTAMNALNAASMELVSASAGMVSATEAKSIITKNSLTLATIRQMWAQSALNKAMIANPYAVLFVAVVALAGAMWTLYDASSEQEKIQKRLNELNEQQSKQSDEAKSTAESLISVITSETSTVARKIEALNRLKEIYPDFVKNMDYHAIAAMNAGDRQKLLNEAVDDFNVESIDTKIKKTKAAIDSLTGATEFSISAKSTAGDLLGYSTFDKFEKSVSKYNEDLNIQLSALKQQKQIQLDIAEQAKFDLLPQEEKLKIWEKQIEQLESVKAGMISAAKSSDYLSTSLVKPKEKWDLMAETDIFKLSLTSADFLNKKIFDLKNLMSGTAALPDTKEYWEKQLTAARGVWDELSRKEDLGSGNKSKWSEAAKDADKNIKIAEKALLAWDRSTKSQKKSEDAAAKALEIKIGLLKESYEIYKKLAEIKGKDAAKEMIATDPAFARYKNLPGGAKVPTSTTELSNAIAPVIAASNQNSAGVKKMYRENAKLGMEGYIEGVKESSDKIFKTLNDAISDYKPKYDLYEKLLGLTGDRKKSSQLAFGKDAVDDYETFLRNQYAKLPSATFFSELTPPAEGATEEVKKAWKDLVEYIQSKKLGKIEYFEQIISEASRASDKIKVIELKREQDILDAKKAFANDPAQMKLAVDAVKSTSEQQINEIRSQLFQLTPLYDEVFKDLGKVAAGNLDDLLAKTNGLVNLVKTKGEPKKGSNGETTGYFLKAGVTDPNSGLKIEKDTLISVEKYNDLIERTNSIVNKINENPFKALFNPPKGATTETVEEKAKRIAGAIQGISDLANSVAGDLGGVMDSFGASNESKESLNNIMNLATGAAQAGTGVAKLAAGDIVGGIKDLASGIAKTIMSLNAIHDAKYEKQIKAYQKQIDATAKSYDKLTESLSRKTAASKVDAQAEEYNLLQREKSLLEAQKRAEEAKKKTDQSKIDDYNKQIEEATKKQQELALNTISYVLGGSIGAQADSWAKTLTDAMDTAFQNGTDAAKAWGDSVDTIVRDIAKNFIVNSFLGNQLQGWLEAASADWTDANKNINQAAIESDLKAFSEFAKSLEPATEAALKALNSIYGDGKTGSAGTGLTGEIKGVTEDTAQRLASLLNAIRQDSGVNRLAFAEMKNILSEFNRGSIEANSYLNKINENTRLTAENTAAIVRAFNDVTGVGSQGKALRVL